MTWKYITLIVIITISDFRTTSWRDFILYFPFCVCDFFLSHSGVFFYPFLYTQSCGCKEKKKRNVCYFYVTARWRRQVANGAYAFFFSLSLIFLTGPRNVMCLTTKDCNLQRTMVTITGVVTDSSRQQQYPHHLRPIVLCVYVRVRTNERTPGYWRSCECFRTFFSYFIAFLGVNRATKGV